MSEVASAYVSLLPSAKGFGSKLTSSVGGEVKTAGKSLGSLLGKTLGLAASAAAAFGAVDFLKGSIDEAREAQKVGALTAQVIKSTGAAAGVSAKQVGDLATAISNKVGIDDEAIQSGENLLLTFKNIKGTGGVFKDATQSTVDMAAALAAASGGAVDFRSSATLVGKALNDPIKGLTALQRVGVTFTQGQKDQIAALVKSGQTMQAQKIILTELKSEFGGAAAAQATAGEKAAVAFGNLKEAVGTLLLPALDDAENALATVANFASRNIGPAFDRMKSALGPAVSNLRDLGGIAFDKIKGSIGPVVDGLKGLAQLTWDKLQSGVQALKQLGQVDFSHLDGAKLGQQLGTAIAAGLSGLADVASKLTAALGAAMSKIDFVGLGITLGKQAPALLLGFAAGLLNFDVGSLFKGIGAHWSDILIGVITLALAPAKLIGPLAKILERIPFVGRFLAQAVRWISELGTKLVNFGKDLLGSFFKGLTGDVAFPGAKIISKVLTGLKGLPGKVGDFFSLLGTRIGVWALDAFEAMGRGARSGAAATFSFVKSLPGRILSAIGGLARLLFPRGVETILGLLHGIQGRFGAVLGFVRSIPGKVLGGLGNLAGLLYAKGAALIDGLINGIKSRIGAVGSAIGGIASKIKGFLPGSPVKEGPLTSWNNGGAGKRLVAGLAEGIKKATPDVEKATGDLAKKLHDQLEKRIEAIKQKVKDLRDTLSGLKGAVSGFDLRSTLGVNPANPTAAGVRDNLSGFAASVRQAGGEWTKRLRNMAESMIGQATAIDRTNRAIAAEQAHHDELSATLDTQRQALESLQQTMDQFGQSVAANFTPNTFGQSQGGVTTVTPTVDTSPALSAAVDQLNAAKDHLAALQAAGGSINDRLAAAFEAQGVASTVAKLQAQVDQLSQPITVDTTVTGLDLFTQSLRDSTERATAMTAALSSLAGKLDPATFATLAQSGDLVTAQQLAALSPAALQQVNALVLANQAATANLAALATKTVFGDQQLKAQAAYDKTNAQLATSNTKLQALNDANERRTQALLAKQERLIDVIQNQEQATRDAIQSAIASIPRQIDHATR